LRRVAVAGGVFANVKLNQRIHSLAEVDELFVCPNMGDGGLSLGALAAEGLLALAPVEDVFWGDGFSESEMAFALDRAGLSNERSGEDAIASALARGKLVARFDGRMEWGPRALGNRSVLAATTDRAVVARLNECLKRSDFMPFAPAALAEDAGRYAGGVEKARHAAEYMTACFACTPEMKAEHPAVVHTDDTARIQLVRADRNPAFHRVLSAYRRRTGHGILLNTSFNMHEEPIVRTPEDAVRSFLAAGLDYLALGPFLARAPHLEASRGEVAPREVRAG
jgi:carbamoyltransferase